MASFTLLEQADEDKLHSARLLTVEEKPFKRVTKRLLAADSPIQKFSSRLPSPPTEEPEDLEARNSENTAVSVSTSHDAFLKELQRFREDVILDFAAFDSSIARIQFLRAANEKERERYAAEKIEIEATAQEVRDNTARMRIQLDEAQKTLAVRKTYDLLAGQITNNKALRPRDEQHVNIEKLKAEIEDLERESREHAQAWVDRREQLGRLTGEGMRLRLLIRDEKEEPEKQDEGEDMLGVDDDQEPTSQVGTPRPVDEARDMPAHDSGALTPRSNVPDGGTSSSPPDTTKDSKDFGTNGDVPMADGVSHGADQKNPAIHVIPEPADHMDVS